MPSLPPPNPGLYDEMFDGATPRAHCAAYADWLHGLSDEALSARQREADLLFRRHGVTFTLRDNPALDRHIPFDIVPRILPARDWALLVVMGLGPLGAAFFLWDRALKLGDARQIAAWQLNGEHCALARL